MDRRFWADLAMGNSSGMLEENLPKPVVRTGTDYPAGGTNGGTLINRNRSTHSISTGYSAISIDAGPPNWKSASL